MVLDVARERAQAGLERHALRHGPAREHAAALEPEVVMEPACVVALDDEDGLLLRAPRPGALCRHRLGCARRVALAAVRGQVAFRHLALLVDLTTRKSAEICVETHVETVENTGVLPGKSLWRVWNIPGNVG